MKPFQTPALFLALVLTIPVWAAEPAGSGRVVFADGTVTADGKPIAEGALLTGPITLKTGPASELEVVFDGRNVFRLGASTVARIDFSTVRKVVVVDRGSFSAVLKQLAQGAGGTGFTLRTPTVAAGVRGTTFHAEVTEQRTYFCTCNGTVALDNGTPADALLVTKAHHGAQVYTRDTGGRITVAVGGQEGHDDALMERLARRINYTIDWTRAD